MTFYSDWKIPSYNNAYNHPYLDSIPDEELNDPYLEGLKAHLHIKTNKSCLINDKEINNGLFIDLSNTNDKSDEDSINTIEKETNEKLLDENSQKILIRPKLL